MWYFVVVTDCVEDVNGGEEVDSEIDGSELENVVVPVVDNVERVDMSCDEDDCVDEDELVVCDEVPPFGPLDMLTVGVPVTVIETVGVDEELTVTVVFASEVGGEVDVLDCGSVSVDGGLEEASVETVGGTDGDDTVTVPEENGTKVAVVPSEKSGEDVSDELDNDDIVWVEI